MSVKTWGSLKYNDLEMVCIVCFNEELRQSIWVAMDQDQIILIDVVLALLCEIITSHFDFILHFFDELNDALL